MIDLTFNTLFVAGEGHITLEDALHLYSRLKQYIKVYLKPGFQIVSDPTGILTISHQASELLNQIAAFARENGMSRLLKVTKKDNAHLSTEFKMMGKYLFPKSGNSRQ